MDRKDTAFYFDEKCFWHDSPSYVTILPVGGWVQPSSSVGHAESPETKRRMKNLIEVSGLADKLFMSSANMATKKDLLLIHTPEYLEKFKLLSDAGGGDLGDYATIGNGSYEIASLSAGLAIAAVDAVMTNQVKNAYVLSRPPGHHCLPNQAMGFCFLSNIGIAIEHAKEKFNLNRIAVVDWDVHHGNGTQTIFYARSDVLTISIHQDGCFPAGYSGQGDRGEGEGVGANINIPLLPGSGHDSYMYAMEKIVIPALDNFQPELIIVACGFDANSYDPLSHMILHSDSYRKFTSLVKKSAEKHAKGNLVIIHEGGYSEMYVPFCGLAVMEELSGIKTDVEDPLIDLINLQQPKQEFLSLQESLIDTMVRDYNLSN